MDKIQKLLPEEKLLLNELVRQIVRSQEAHIRARISQENPSHDPDHRMDVSSQTYLEHIMLETFFDMVRERLEIPQDQLMLLDPASGQVCLPPAECKSIIV